MPIGYGAGAGSPTAKKRKLSKVSTFRDMQNGGTAGPSMARPSGIGGFQPGGFGPAGVGGAKIRKTAGAATRVGAGQPHTTSGYVTSATPPVSERTYSEASRPPAAGFGGAPSPAFGAGALPSFAQGPGMATGLEGLAEAGKMVPAGPYLAGMEEAVPGAEEGAGLGAEEGAAEFDPLTGEYSPSVGRAGEVGEARGLTGIAAEQAAGGFAAKEEGDTLDQEMQGLIDEHEASWGDTEAKLNAQLATAMRRQAEVNAAMGSSVSGGYAGATAATILGSLQVMADAYAAHQKEGRNLQLSWLEKRMNMDFEREGWAVQDARMALSELLSDPEAEISEEAWEAAYPDAAERAAAKESVEGGGGLPGFEGATPEGTTGEPGALKNEAGDFLMGPGGKGTAGEIQGDPWAEDGESHQWYARFHEEWGTGEGGEHKYEYYRIDEDGNEVRWNQQEGGGRWPGDVSFLNRGEARGSTIYPGGAYGRGVWSWGEGGYDESARQHPDSGYSVTEGAGEEFLDSLATSLGYEGIADMFGQGIGDEWMVTHENTGQVSLSEAKFGDQGVGGVFDATYYRSDNLAIPALIEMMQFVSLYRHQSEPQGESPSQAEIFDHLKKAGALPHGTPSNPFEDEGDV